jgi:hypothetical protein
MRHLASFGDSGSSFSFEMPDRGPPRAYGGVRASPFQPPPVMEGALGPIEPLSFQHRGWMDKNGWACSKTCRYLDGRCVVRQHHARGLQRTLEWRDNDELRIPPLNRFLRPHSPLSTLSQMDRSENPVGAIDTCSSVACWTPKAVSRASRCSVVPRAHRPSVSGWRNIHEIPELAREGSWTPTCVAAPAARHHGRHRAWKIPARCSKFGISDREANGSVHACRVRTSYGRAAAARASRS